MKVSKIFNFSKAIEVIHFVRTSIACKVSNFSKLSKFIKFFKLVGESFFLKLFLWKRRM